MEGTDIHSADKSYVHDHTYYGNGCERIWEGDPPYYNGSTISCTTRMVQTFDGEDQENGVYYNFTASTSGTSNSVTTGNVPDSFCPLGWQLPYGGTGGDYYDKSKSWKYLLSEYSYGDSKAGIDKAMSFPLSLVKGGDYQFSTGALYRQNINGNYYAITAENSDNAYRLGIWIGNLTTIYGTTRNGAMTLRCI